MLRDRLRPYILKHTKLASETGAPIMRPMFFDFYDDKICYTLDDQYMFGEDILFAPIYKQGVTERQVYLPKGNWVKTSDKTEYEGEQFVTCHAEIDEFIAFVKKDADILSAF